MKLKLIAFIIFISSASINDVFGQQENLLPKPVSYVRMGKDFVTDGAIKPNIRLTDSIPGAPLGNKEAYRLVISKDAITIDAASEQAAYWALQTLEQLSWRKGGKRYLPSCVITDYPAFPIRGFMQDVGRSYISMEELKREIAILSKFKVNVFHWHLTENQAWRLESKLYPQLTDSANMTRMPGKYYTLEEAKKLVEFCKKHHVTLIPEIDMPGHSAAFERAFACDMQSDRGMEILKCLMDEVCDVFDVPYVHIGTDEVKFTNPDFVPQMVSYIRSKGKKLISWNPGWNYKPGEIDMTQMWSYRGKPTDGIPAIDCRFHYLNHFDTFADIVALYTSNIYGQNDASGGIVGAVLALWHDRLVSSERNMILENNFYPNMLALAERAWRGGGSQYFDKNGVNMPDRESEEFNEFADFERRLIWHRDNTFKGYPFGYVRQTDAEWIITDAFPNGGNLAASFPPETELKDSYLYNGKEYGTKTAIGSGIYLRHVWGKTIPAFYDNPEENHTAYAYTWVYSPKKQTVGLWAEFQNYSRSEMDLPPRQGTWDYKGSRIWINDSEIAPPVWSASHTVKSNEIPLGNENFLAREPIRVELKRGWNKVFLKLPVGKFNTPEVRLLKWMFAVTFVDPVTHKEISNLKYSTVIRR